jgi:tryptophanyl-tRNA synthetase
MVNDSAYVDAVLREGAGRAAEIAAPILAEVYDIVGFLRP